MLFQREKTGSSAQVTLGSLYESSLLRIETKVRLDSTIVEADNFAAVACWEPPRTDHLNHSVEELEELEKERPIYADFIRNIEATKEACLGGTQEYW
jgi:RimJ/RimL family protein N-acetyltransferase